MQKDIQQEIVDYISFEDCNTRGLSKERYSDYAFTMGGHTKDTDREFEKQRGGSHGVGKIASNASSSLHIMYFANCDLKGNKQLGGTVHLIEHEYKSKFYKSTGYFAKKIPHDFIPYENTYDGLFMKDTPGLKIIIPFLRKGYANTKEIIKSICDSFFLAIIRNELIVFVDEIEINKKNIKKYILDSKYYTQNPTEIRKEFTPLYYQTYQDEKPREIIIKDLEQEYPFNLYLKYDKKIKKARIAIIRTIGMKIEDKTITNRECPKSSPTKQTSFQI